MPDGQMDTAADGQSKIKTSDDRQTDRQTVWHKSRTPGKCHPITVHLLITDKKQGTYQITVYLR